MCKGSIYSVWINEPLASGSLLEYFNLPMFSSRNWVFSINLLGTVKGHFLIGLAFDLLKHGLEIINYYLPFFWFAFIPIVLGATRRHSVSQPAGFLEESMSKWRKMRDRNNKYCFELLISEGKFSGRKLPRVGFGPRSYLPSSLTPPVVHHLPAACAMQFISISQLHCMAPEGGLFTAFSFFLVVWHVES